MDYLLLTPFVLVAASAFGLSLIATVRCYRTLPADVPDHFDGYGWPDGFGPRPMIFAMVAAQIVPLAIWAALIHVRLAEEDPRKFIVVSGFIADGLLVALAWMQIETLAVAQGKSERIERPYRPVLAIFGGIVLAVTAARFFR